jgi:hypothetical protein
VTMPVGVTISLVLGMAFGVHTTKATSFRFWPSLFAMLAAWICLEVVLCTKWFIFPHNSQESMAVSVHLPFHVLGAAPAALSCGVMQRFGRGRGDGLMGIMRGFGIILISATGFGIAGCLVGYLLASFAPGYYRSVCYGGNSPSFDPVAVGVGLGLTHGMTAGLIVGAVVVVAVAWSRSK